MIVTVKKEGAKHDDSTYRLERNLHLVVKDVFMLGFEGHLL